MRQGIWLVSVDEKTSIQAREGEQPPRPALPGKPMLHEARYHRRGARHLFAGLSVADGKVYGTCRPRKCFVDFQAFVQQEIIPEALRRQVHTVIFILDNGTTHAPNSSNAGSANKNASVKSSCTSRCIGCRLMLPGWIKSKSGSACCNANTCNPILMLWKLLSVNTSLITTKWPNRSTGLTRLRSLSKNSEHIYDSLY